MSNGTDMRRLAELRRRLQDKKATEFGSPEELKQYLKDHPNADKSKHTVKDSEGGGGKKDDGGSSKPIEMSREGYKAVSTSLQGFEKPGAWQHVISFANWGKPMDPKHVKAVIDDITDDLKNWKAVAGANGWSAADKKNLTKAKGVLEGNLAKSQGKQAHQNVYANSADMRLAEYQSEADQFAAALKKKWRTVKYDPKTGQGSADLGGFGITFFESGNDAAVIVNFTKMPRMKAHPEAVLNALEDLRKVWMRVD